MTSPRQANILPRYNGSRRADQPMTRPPLLPRLSYTYGRLITRISNLRLIELIEDTGGGCSGLLRVSMHISNTKRLSTHGPLTKSGSSQPLLALVLSVLLLLISACDSGPSSLPADKRPIPAQSPNTEREALRRLPFEGAHNFRDIGGYKTTDGRRVKWGMIYRSDKLSELTPADEQYMERLGLARIVDFRSTAEREAEPDRIAPDSSIAIEPMPINVDGTIFDVIKAKIESGDIHKDEMNQIMIDANRDLVEKYTIIYRPWAQSLLDEQRLPMMFHCTAGKDRTGFGAAIILLAVGVPMDTVMQDYLATNAYTAEHIDKMLLMIKVASLFQADTEALRPLMGVQAEFLQEAFKAIEEHYGSIDVYLEEGLGLDGEKRARLRELLTEEV